MQRTLDPTSDDAGMAFNTSRPKSAASWGAILSGALVAISVTLVLIALGTGLGFASISPWPNQGAGASAVSIAAVIWFIVMQWVSSLFGGYITGRLRTRWFGTHTHEVFFRDTANGLVTWALATLVVAVVLASSVASGVGAGVKAVSTVTSAGAAGAAQGAMSSGSSTDFGYGVDKLFRAPSTAGGTSSTGPSTTGSSPDDSRAEATRILANSLATGSLPDGDRTYLAGIVAAHAGIPEADAEKRVDDLVAAATEAQNKVKAAADAARKSAAELAIYTALAMLIGAFIASAASALGGRQRDEHI